MKNGAMLLAVVGLGGLSAPVAAQDKPVVAMIGTGNLAARFGPAIARAGYSVVYGSRDPARDSVRALVQRTGANASAATPPQAAQEITIASCVPLA